MGKKEIIDRIRRIISLGNPVVSHSLIDVPDEEIIDCEIETPQFHGCQKKCTAV